MGDSELTLEETNKVRISLGLQPLADPSAPLAEGEEPELDADQEAEANYARRREADEKAAETKLLQARIDKARNKRELAAKLTGNTLGDEPTEDAAAWAKKAKKRAKQLAAERALVEKREKEQLELDELGRADLYSEKDLSGIKVSHDMDDFDEGEHILTLKDSRILDGDEDELENEDLERLAKDAKDKELKKKQPGYSAYDDDEFDPDMVGKKRKVLSKYDVDIDGEQDGGFRLGSAVAPKKRPADELIDDADDNVNRTLLTGGLIYEKNQDVSDYLQEGDAGFKKPKKKKKRSTRVVEVDEERAPAVKLEADAMDVDGPVASSSRLASPPPPVENYIDDDELQSALAQQRRKKAKKTAKLTPEEIARQLAEQKAEEEAAAAVTRASEASAKVEAEDDRIQFDETSEFVRSVQMQPVVQVIRTSVVPANAVASSSGVKAEEAEVNLDLLLAQDVAGDVKMEDDDDEPEDEVDEQLAEMALRQGLSIEEMRIKMDADLAKEEPQDDAEIGTASEAVIGRGLAGALALLKSTGNLEANASADVRERERTQKEKDLWLADRRRRLAQRELERIQARGGNKDQATLEYEKRMREQREAADAVEQFRSYKPDVNIVYHDEFGRELTPKEAWKALSHRFHGKGSGKGKTEKRLAKIQLERKREAMSMGDTSLSKNFNERAARTGEAYMVLSSGNKGTVTEGKADKKRK